MPLSVRGARGRCRAAGGPARPCRRGSRLGPPPPRAAPGALRAAGRRWLRLRRAHVSSGPGCPPAARKAAHPPAVRPGSGGGGGSRRRPSGQCWGEHGVLAAEAGARPGAAVGLVLPGAGLLAECAGLPRVLRVQLLAHLVHGIVAGHRLFPRAAEERRGRQCYRDVSTARGRARGRRAGAGGGSCGRGRRGTDPRQRLLLRGQMRCWKPESSV